MVDSRGFKGLPVVRKAEWSDDAESCLESVRSNAERDIISLE